MKTASVEIRRFKTGAYLDWVRCGWRLFGKNTGQWLMMSLLYTLFAFSLTQIPFIGGFVLIFVSPIIVASALLTAYEFAEQAKARKRQKDNPPEFKRSLGERLGDSMADSVKLLFSVLRHEDRIMPIFELSAIVLLFGLVGQAVVYLVGGTTLLGNTIILDVGMIEAIRIAGAGLVVVGLYVLSALLFFFAVPLCAFRGESAISAIRYSFRGATRNLGSFVAYIAVLAVPFILSGVFMSNYFPWGLAAALIIITSVLPALINSAFCCYRLVYR